MKEEGRGSTGRTEPNDLEEELAMDGAKRNPFNPGEGDSSKKIMSNMGDPRWPGWEKWQIVYYLESGRKIVIHFLYDPINKLFDDFKFV